MRLEGKTIYLRPLALEDANGHYPSWLNDPEVCRYNSHGETLYTKKMAQDYISSITDNPTCKVFAICDKIKDEHIGNISLQAISTKNQSAEFAILLGNRNFWGKGVAKEAGKLLVDYGFHNLELHRIYCGTSVANIAMQKLAIYLGMKQEGVRKEAMRKNGQFYDIIEYGVIRE